MSLWSSVDDLLQVVGVEEESAVVLAVVLVGVLVGVLVAALVVVDFHAAVADFLVAFPAVSVVALDLFFVVASLLVSAVLMALHTHLVTINLGNAIAILTIARRLCRTCRKFHQLLQKSPLLLNLQLTLQPNLLKTPHKSNRKRN
ncbi:hypothetical protein AeMF1_003362 [Aphanomyces euteiches]|nr:hypothetical protein AeMF1_003362 [Aphanomyces euteiches]